MMSHGKIITILAVLLLSPLFLIQSVQPVFEGDGTFHYNLQIEGFVNDTLTMTTFGESPWINSISSDSYLLDDSVGQDYAWNFTFSDLPFTDEEWSDPAKGEIKSINVHVYAEGEGDLKMELFNSNGESCYETWDLENFPLESPPYRYYGCLSCISSKFDTKDELEDAHLQITSDPDTEIKIWYVELKVGIDAYLPLPRNIHNNALYDYVPILDDPNLDINDYHDIRPKGGDLPYHIYPQHNETWNDGQWWAGLGHKPSPTSFAFTNNGFGYLYTDNDDNDPFIWSSSGFAQGMCVYGGGRQFGMFNATNSTISENSLGIYLNASEPFDDELWLYTRSKIDIREPLRFDVRSCTSLGIFAGFQYVFEDGGKLYYSNYLAPDETSPYPYLQVLHCDLMIDRRWWDIGIPTQVMQKGEHYEFSGGYFDDDRHLQLIISEPMNELGVWYSFKINFTWVLETIRQMILEDFEKLRGEWGSGLIWSDFMQIWKKWYNPDCYLKGLILREFYWFQEVNEAKQKSITDYVMLVGGNLSETWTDITIESVPDKNCNWKGASVFLDGSLYGVTPQTIPLLKGKHTLFMPSEVWTETSLYTHFYKLKYYLVDGEQIDKSSVGWYLNFHPEELSNHTITAYYEWYDKIGRFGNVGGDEPLKMGRSRLGSPPQKGDYGRMQNFLTIGYVDDYLMIDIRKTLGNKEGIMAFDVFEDEIWLDLTNIKSINFKLGKLFEEKGYDYGKDVTMAITHDNVSRLDMIFRDVPYVWEVKYNGLEFDQWNYSGGDLWIWLLPHQHSVIDIDFETLTSQMNTWINACALILGIGICIAIIRKVDL